MDTSNPVQLPESPKPFNYHWVYLGIIALLLGGLIYQYIQQNKTDDTLAMRDEQLLEVSNDKSVLETEYNEALRRLDEMKSQSLQMDSLLTSKDGEISSMKSKIERLLKQKKLSTSELAEANKLISELKQRMNGYVEQVRALKEENIELTEQNKSLSEEKEQLSSEKSQLSEEKKSLERTVELGSVLHASNIRMEVIDNRKNLLGKEKEKETDKAKRADLLRITFDLDDNRISESGEKMVYICIYNPSGQIVGQGGQRFHTAEQGDKSYTTRKTIPYKQGEKTRGISTDYKPDQVFAKGAYRVELYHQGYLIGKETVSLR